MVSAEAIGGMAFLIFFAALVTWVGPGERSSSPWASATRETASSYMRAGSGEASSLAVAGAKIET